MLLKTSYKNRMDKRNLEKIKKEEEKAENLRLCFKTIITLALQVGMFIFVKHVKIIDIVRFINTAFPNFSAALDSAASSDLAVSSDAYLILIYVMMGISIGVSVVCITGIYSKLK